MKKNILLMLLTLVSINVCELKAMQSNINTMSEKQKGLLDAARKNQIENSNLNYHYPKADRHNSSIIGPKELACYLALVPIGVTFIPWLLTQLN